MQVFMDIVFVIIIVFFSYRFILSLFRMKKRILFPTAKEKMKAIRKYPQKITRFPG